MGKLPNDLNTYKLYLQYYVGNYFIHISTHVKVLHILVVVIVSCDLRNYTKYNSSCLFYIQ